LGFHFEELFGEEAVQLVSLLNIDVDCGGDLPLPGHKDALLAGVGQLKARGMLRPNCLGKQAIEETLDRE